MACEVVPMKAAFCEDRTMKKIPILVSVLWRRLYYHLRAIVRRPIRSTNVLDYGADPTGTLNSQKALQNAIDSVSFIGVPPGTFLISDVQKIVKPNTSIHGAGPEGTIFRMRPDGRHDR